MYLTRVDAPLRPGAAGMVRITAGLQLEARGRPRSEYLAVYRQALDALLQAETV